MPEFEESKGFKLRSGNKSPFKQLGSSPAKHPHKDKADHSFASHVGEVVKKGVEYGLNPGKGVVDAYDYATKYKGKKMSKGVGKGGQRLLKKKLRNLTEIKMDEVERKRREEELKKVKKVKVRKKDGTKKKIKEDIPKTIKKPDPIKVETDKNTPDPNPNFYERTPDKKEGEKDIPMSEKDRKAMPKGA